MKKYTKDLLPLAQAMRRTMTPAEYRLWEDCLKHMPVKFRRQRPFGPYILDFYCASAKLVIEIDGDSHSIPEIIHSDIMRTDYLQIQGLEILRFTNHDVTENLDGIDATIREYLKNK